MITYQSYSSTETKKFGKELAKEIIKSKPAKKAVIVALTGELGGGKTTFAQGFAAGLGVRGKIQSPTFILMRNTEIGKRNFVHIDACRIKNSNELIELGFKQIIADARNIILVEWADKLKNILPKEMIRLEFEHGRNENHRVIKTGNTDIF